ncbi:MAG TPA: hypothetical protein VGC86_14050 [Afipia sp.]
MFGFFKFKKTVDYATKYVLTMIAPAQQTAALRQTGFPNAVFADAYILGFLQILVMHAANESQGKALQASHQKMVFEGVLNQLVPGLGQQMEMALMQLNTLGVRGNENYLVGRREAHEYVRALMSGDDANAQRISLAFTDFIKRNHLGLSK